MGTSNASKFVAIQARSFQAKSWQPLQMKSYFSLSISQMDALSPRNQFVKIPHHQTHYKSDRKWYVLAPKAQVRMTFDVSFVLSMYESLKSASETQIQVSIQCEFCFVQSCVSPDKRCEPMQRAVCVVWQDAAATIIKQGPLALLRITQKSPFSFYPTCSCENNFKNDFQHFHQLRCTTLKVP